MKKDGDMFSISFSSGLLAEWVEKTSFEEKRQAEIISGRR
jgi:hypothetical protein